MSRSFVKTGGLILSYFLKILIFVLLIVSIYNLHLEWIFGTSLALVVSFVPSILKRNYKITLPLTLDILITVALLLHIGGGLLGAYKDIPNYDAITHFVSSFLVAFLAFVVIFILDVHWDGLIMDKYAMAFLVVIVTIAMGVIWEFNEWITDLVFGTYEQWGYNDTLKDLFIDTLAGIFMAILGVNLIKRSSFNKFTEELGEQLDRRIIDKIENKKRLNK